MNKYLKFVSITTLAVLIAMMAAATVLEKTSSSNAAVSAVYHSPVFMILWAIAAIFGLVLVMRSPGGRRVFTAGLHVALAIILVGALVTHLGGKKGSIHLRGGEQTASLTLEDGSEASLPFSLRLESFTLERYTGSQAAADYHSTVTVLPEGKVMEISMNHIGKIRGWRFYQADFDADGQGSTLSVSHDPWGIGITYCGYLLLLICMVGFFFQKKSGFRTALRRLSKSTLLLVCLLMASRGEAYASRLPGDTPKVLPVEVAAAFDELYVYYNDRICPFETLARDYSLKAYGKPGWNEFSATQVVTGWLFYYDWWEVIPFKVKSKDRGTAKESEKDYIRRSVASGNALKLYPLTDSKGELRWYDCNETLPEEVFDNYDLWVFVRKVMDLVEESVRKEDWPEVVRIIGKIRDYQVKTAGQLLPGEAKIRAEKLYNRMARPMIPFMASITLGLLLFIFFGLRRSRGKDIPLGLCRILALLGALLLCYLSLTLGLRWFVSGHAPFAGSWCVMMLMAWLSSLAMLLLWRKFPLIQPLGFILSGFTMLMASLAGANPQITHLMPVLQSPLLSIHVLSMMLSYTLLGLVTLNGVMGVLLSAAREKLRDVSLVILYPAVFILTFGTFLGAVWANISWGSYWSWDPKETWALITILIYAATLHSGSVRSLRRPLLFHVYTILAFLAVLITYFGVNLFLGGMHAYA